MRFEADELTLLGGIRHGRTLGSPVAIEIANSTEYGLSCAIYTRDIGATFTAINELEFGVVYVNAPTIGAEVQLPFGGMKGTGNGHREAGPQALDEFTEWKAVSVDFSGKVQKAQMDE